MADVDKPFPCNIGSCKQSFANAEHLQVHLHKHTMSLTMKSLDTPIIADTTPTPTRFLKDTEEGLFSSLGNPFDVEFGKASEERRNSVSKPGGESNSQPSKESKQDSGDSQIVEAAQVTSNPSSQQDTAAGVMGPAVSVIVVKGEEPTFKTKDITEMSTPDVIEALSLPLEAIPSPKLKTVPEQPVKSEGATFVVNNVPPVSAPVAQQTIAGFDPALISGVAAAITAPVMLRLPDGTSIRVVPSAVANPLAPIPTAISAVQQKSTIPANKHVAIASMPKAAAGSNAAGNVREKLKETLLLNQNQGNMTVMAQAVEVVTKREQQQKHQQIIQPVAIPQKIMMQDEKGQMQSQAVTGEKTKSSEDDDEEPEVKRQKFLERNRAAAMRCRNKKKTWIVNLEKKADNLTVTNLKLNTEVSRLKEEVAQLKQLLLAHKECPVTLMQQSINPSYRPEIKEEDSKVGIINQDHIMLSDDTGSQESASITSDQSEPSQLSVSNGLATGRDSQGRTIILQLVQNTDT